MWIFFWRECSLELLELYRVGTGGQEWQCSGILFSDARFVSKQCFERAWERLLANKPGSGKECAVSFIFIQECLPWPVPHKKTLLCVIYQALLCVVYFSSKIGAAMVSQWQSFGLWKWLKSDWKLGLVRSECGASAASCALPPPAVTLECKLCFKAQHGYIPFYDEW